MQIYAQIIISKCFTLYPKNFKPLLQTPSVVLDSTVFKDQKFLRYCLVLLERTRWPRDCPVTRNVLNAVKVSGRKGHFLPFLSHNIIPYSIQIEHKTAERPWSNNLSKCWLYSAVTLCLSGHYCPLGDTMNPSNRQIPCVAGTFNEHTKVA